ncbi:MAG: SGNH/GDSL hydrolase family protein, partial [Verrucomicrobiales bacterium]
MKPTSCCLLALLALSQWGNLGNCASETVAGLVLPREGGGMILRSAGGDIEVGWSDETKVALEVNTRQLGQLSDVPKTPAQVAREMMSEVERLALDQPAETFAAAGVVLERFLSAPDYQERLQSCRDAERVRPLMEEYYSREKDGMLGFRKPRDGWQMRPYRSFLLAQVELDDFRSLPIVLERQSDGSYLVDWESFVGYCEIPWVKFQSDRPTDSFLIRARASAGDYFNYGYEKSEWVCLKLEDSAQNHCVYGYIKVDDPLLEEVRQVMAPSGVTHLMLNVAYPTGGEAGNQVLITGLVEKGWVRLGAAVPPAEPADRRFEYRVPWSTQTVEFPIPAGLIGGHVEVRDVGEALGRAEQEGWIEERRLRLSFGLDELEEHLPSTAEPYFSGRWIPETKPRMLEIDGRRYELALKRGGQADALLFNLLDLADCQAYANRATVIGRRDGEAIIADEIHLKPVGDQAALDDPELPRYLFIGDSISGNYARGLRAALAGKFNLHHPPTNCGPSRKGRSQILEWLGAYGEERRGWDVISFNFGHWDAGNDRETYQANLEAVITEVKNTGAALVWVTTCPVPGGMPPAGELGEDGKAPSRTSGVMRKFLNPWAE